MTIFNNSNNQNNNIEIFREYYFTNSNDKKFSGNIIIKIGGINLNESRSKNLKYFKLITYSRYENSIDSNIPHLYNNPNDNISSNNSLDINGNFDIKSLKNNNSVFGVNFRITENITKKILENFSLKKTYNVDQNFDISQYDTPDSNSNIAINFLFKDIDNFNNTSNDILDFFIYAYDINNEIIDKFSIKNIQSTQIIQKNITMSKEINWLKDNLDRLFDFSFPVLEDEQSKKNLEESNILLKDFYQKRFLRITKTNFLKEHIATMSDKSYIRSIFHSVSLKEYFNNGLYFYLGQNTLFSDFLLDNNDTYLLEFNYLGNSLTNLIRQTENIFSFGLKYSLTVSILDDVDSRSIFQKQTKEKNFRINVKDPSVFNDRLNNDIKEIKIKKENSNMISFFISMNSKTFNVSENYFPIITKIKCNEKYIEFKNIYSNLSKNRNFSLTNYISCSMPNVVFFIDLNSLGGEISGTYNFDIVFKNRKYQNMPGKIYQRSITIPSVQSRKVIATLNPVIENSKINIYNMHTYENYLYSLQEINTTSSASLLSTGISLANVSLERVSNILPEDVKSILFNRKTGLYNFFLLIKKQIKFINNTIDFYEIIDITEDIINEKLEYSFSDDNLMVNFQENISVYQNPAISRKHVSFEVKLLAIPIKYFTNELKENIVLKNIYDIIYSNNLQIMPTENTVSRIKNILNVLNERGKTGLNQDQIADLYTLFGINDSYAKFEKEIQKNNDSTQLTSTREANYNVTASMYTHQTIDVDLNFSNRPSICKIPVLLDMSSLSIENIQDENAMLNIITQLVNEKKLTLSGLYFKDEQNSFIPIQSAFRNFIRDVPQDFLPWESNDNNEIIKEILNFQNFSIERLENLKYKITFILDFTYLNKLLFLLSIIKNDLSPNGLFRFNNLKNRLYQKITSTGTTSFSYNTSNNNIINLKIKLKSLSLETQTQKELYVKYNF